MENEFWSSEMTTRLSGIIFRKALMSGNWSEVYENVVTEMINSEEDFVDEMQVLRIFGDVGG